MSVCVLVGQTSLTQVDSSAGILSQTWPQAVGYQAGYYDPVLNRTIMYEGQRAGTIYSQTWWAYDVAANNFTSLMPGSPNPAWLYSTNIYGPNLLSYCPPPDTGWSLSTSDAADLPGTYYVRQTYTLSSTATPPNVEWDAPSQLEKTITVPAGKTLVVGLVPSGLAGLAQGANIYVGTSSGEVYLQAANVPFSEGSWTMMSPPATNTKPLTYPRFPFDRQNFQQIAWDSHRERLWLYGGACSGGLADMYYFDPNAWLSLTDEQKIAYSEYGATDKNPPPPVEFWHFFRDYGLVGAGSNHPGRNLEMATAYVPPLTDNANAIANGDKVYFYGGTTGTMAVMYQFNPETGDFQKTSACNGTGQPGPKDASRMFWNPHQKKLYLFGGGNNNQDFAESEVWTWDPAAGAFGCGNWELVNPVTVNPLPGHVCEEPDEDTMGCPPRDKFSNIAYDTTRNLFFQIAGSTGRIAGTWTDVTYLQKWTFNPVTATWQEWDIEGGWPIYYGNAGSQGFIMVYDPVADKYVTQRSNGDSGKTEVWTLSASVFETPTSSSTRIRGATIRGGVIR